MREVELFVSGGQIRMTLNGKVVFHYGTLIIHGLTAC